MILLSLLFKLGVRFAIFNFIWFFLESLLRLFTGFRQQSLLEFYALKAIKYMLLVGITFAYCLDYSSNSPTYVLDWQKLAPGGLILMLYLLGRFQKQQERLQMFARFQLPIAQQPYSIQFEIGLLIMSALIFFGLYFNPSMIENVILYWFENNIRGLEKAFLLGFIFQVLGFFFVLGVFVRLLQAFRPKPPRQNGPNQPWDQYSDFEEVSDEHLE